VKAAAVGDDPEVLGKQSVNDVPGAVVDAGTVDENDGWPAAVFHITEMGSVDLGNLEFVRHGWRYFTPE
jgi:hypothetical protein